MFFKKKLFSKAVKKLAKKHNQFNQKYCHDLESLLISFDLGVKTSIEIVELLTKKIKNKSKDFNFVYQELKKILISYYHSQDKKNNLKVNLKKLNIFFIVGVNGSGKTSLIAKLGHYYQNHNFKVLLVGADTFRAGAKEQITLWGQKLNLKVICAKKLKQDSSSVIYEGITYARNNNFNLVLIDTAGRLQNKKNLMLELQKNLRIIKTKLNAKINEVILVLDANTGQNGLNQAEIFLKMVNVSGIALTKLDGSAKGGIAIAIKREFKIPVKLITYGEHKDDLKFFEIESFISEMMQGLTTLKQKI